MNKILVLLIACISFNMASAQFNINDYKYVIVEKQFHFQNDANEFDLNRMARFLFKKYGFTAIIDGETLPADLKGNYCLALKSEIKAKGSLRTKAVITLRDCENNEIFVSPEGITKEKDFKRAYEMSMREAFKSLAALNYSYVENQDIIEKGRGDEQIKETPNVDKKEIENLKAEIRELKKKNEADGSIKKVQTKEKITTTKDAKSIEVQPEATNSNWYDGLPSYMHNGTTYYKKPGYGALYFMNKKEEQIFKLQTLPRSNVFILTVDKYQGVAFYDEDMKDYTLQYYTDNGKLETKILKLNQ